MLSHIRSEPTAKFGAAPFLVIDESNFICNFHEFLLGSTGSILISIIYYFAISRNIYIGIGCYSTAAIINEIANSQILIVDNCLSCCHDKNQFFYE